MDASDATPDSPLYLEVDSNGQATVWLEEGSTQQADPVIFYRQDRCVKPVAFTFNLSNRAVVAFQVKRLSCFFLDAGPIIRQECSYWTHGKIAERHGYQEP
jgi:hypothetical protein